ncbi:MAG: GAF domain-containing protein [Sphingobacteriales bacterium]|nr:MAG: GAF domain-containing protein [Sphingobacteriales bacterium]
MSEREPNRLATVRRFLQMNISKEAELQHIVEMAAKICGTPLAMITFMDDETQHIKFKIGTQIKEVPYVDTFCQYTLLNNDLLIIPNALLDNRVKSNPFVLNDPGLRFYAGSPLQTQDDQT